MKRVFLAVFLSAAISAGVCQAQEEKDREDIFVSLESIKEFAGEITSLLEKAWIKWQKAVVVSNVHVEGSRGLLSPGDMRGPVLTYSSIFSGFDRKGKPREYVECVKVVAKAVENGMRPWQRGYIYENIPFPRGASCTYTMPPSENIPVSLASGRSAGDKEMTEEALYSFMIYRAPADSQIMREVFKAAAIAISRCFAKWKRGCSISGILASGGIAPQPAPMGTGPGPVRGARGNGGSLSGPPIDAVMMGEIMAGHFEEQKRGKER